MARTRKDDLKKAREVLDELDLESTSKIVESMEDCVSKRKGIPWSKLQSFLDTFEEESKKHGMTCEETFVTMEKIILQALDDSNSRTRSEFQDRALKAPSIDPHIDALDAGMSILHKEVEAILHNEVEAISLIYTVVLLLMFGHIVRWQAVEDFAKEWVGHWGRGFNNELKKKTIEMLLIIKYWKHASGVPMADTRLYRDAIAHGHFRFINKEHVEFWTRDSRGKKHELPSLTLGNLLQLYNLLEIRLRTMEAFGRVIRAWGRHVV